MKKLSVLTTISPIDGRYYQQTNSLRNIFSEYGLLKFRIQIEIRWFQKLANTQIITEIPTLTNEENTFLNQLIINFNLQDAKEIKKIEQTINHDLKSIEYFIKEKMKILPTLKNYTEFIHFACTSDDINNLAYGLMLKYTIKNIILPMWKKIIDKIKKLSVNYSHIPMLSRTHGQPASPSTIGKETANFAYRFIRQYHQLKSIKILGKINGAVGNYNAHIAAYPKINWHKFSEEFVTSLGMTWNPYTTQIEPHDYIAEISDCIARFNTILINFNRDIWSYISLNYFIQNKIVTNIGSSTMPHKVNPIDFENSEGNLGIANAILNHFSKKLPISRWQRDLSDSTVLRNLGVAIGYALIAYHSVLKGIDTLKINEKNILTDLNQHWLVLSEAIQTTMRRYNIPESYEKTKKNVCIPNANVKTINAFIESLAIPQSAKIRLKNITPTNYIGLAEKIAKKIKHIQ